jgi:hypothetical protein
LLLACRVLLIALVLLALARLTIHSTGGLLGLYGKQAVVVVIDNSASMSGPTVDGKQTKLRLALDSVRALLSHLDPGAEAGVVLLVPDPAAGFETAGMTSDVETLAQSLDRISPTDGTGTLARALARAQMLLRSISASGGAIHIFTDMQDSEWTQKIDERQFKDDIQIVLHRIATPRQEGSNVAIVQAELIGTRVLPKQPYHIQVVLRNDDDADLTVRLNSEDDQRKTHAQSVDIPASQEKTVRLLVQPESPGYHWVKLWLEGDRFAGDNRAIVGYQCEEKAFVLLAGTQADYGVLPLALSPFGDGRFTSLVLGYCKPEELAERIDKQRPTLVVVNWEHFAVLGLAQALETFVNAGGNLAVTPSAAGLTAAIDAPPWLGVKVGPLEKVQDAALTVIDKLVPFWSGLQDAEGRVQFGQAYVRQFCLIELAKDRKYTPLLGIGDKKVLAVTTIGKGQVTVSGLSFDPQWSSLPRTKAMVVMAQTMALGSRGQQSHGLTGVAGNVVELPGQGDEVQMVSLAGDPLDYSGPRTQAPPLPRSGAYSVKLGDASYCLSVRSSDREGSRTFLVTEPPALGNLPYSIRDLDEADLQEALAASRTGFPLFVPLVLLAIAGLVAESLLGAPPLQRKQEQTQEAAP